MNSSKSCACLKHSGTYLLAAIYIVCYSTTLTRITASTIHKETSSGLRVSAPCPSSKYRIASGTSFKR
jgi:hypothetical protein